MNAPLLNRTNTIYRQAKTPRGRYNWPSAGIMIAITSKYNSTEIWINISNIMVLLFYYQPITRRIDGRVAVPNQMSTRIDVRPDKPILQDRSGPSGPGANEVPPMNEAGMTAPEEYGAPSSLARPQRNRKTAFGLDLGYSFDTKLSPKRNQTPLNPDVYNQPQALTFGP